MSWRDGRIQDFGAVGVEAARRVPRWIQQLVELARRQQPTADDRPVGPTPDLIPHLSRLRALAAIRAATTEHITAEVHAAGVAGATYADIADALHMTRQNARKRWPTAVDHPPGRPPGR